MNGKVNVILSDREAAACETFRRGLEEGSGEPWTVWACVSNKGRSRGYNVIRYFKYLSFPLLVYFQRRRFNRIFGWQAFYAVVFAFYRRLLRGKPENEVIGRNLTYRPKGGLIGRFYLKWMQYSVGAGQPEKYTVTADGYRGYLEEMVGLERNRTQAFPLGKEDFSDCAAAKAPRERNTDWAPGTYWLSLGRSNRDYDWLVASFAGTGRHLHIIGDEYRPKGLPDGIRVSGDLSGLDVLPYLRDAAGLILPLRDPSIASGETVLLLGFMFGKPVLVTGPSLLAGSYVRDGETGLVVEKTAAALGQALSRLETDPGLAERLGAAARKEYEERHSEEEYGRLVGAWLRNLQRTDAPSSGQPPPPGGLQGRSRPSREEDTP